MVGMLATSKAGHDMRKIYVIIREEGEYVYLADGYVKTVDRPKKKNRKHIQVIKKMKLEEKASYTDLEIKKILKEYCKNLDKEDK